MQRTMVALLTHMDGPFQKLKVEQLTEVLDNFCVVAPKPVKLNRMISTDAIELLHHDSSISDTFLHGLGGYFQQAGVLYGRAMQVLKLAPWADYLWVIEDDVDFASPCAVTNLVQIYSNDTADLIVSGPLFNEAENPGWPWWRDIDHIFPNSTDSTRWGAFFPVYRISRRLMELSLQFASKDHDLPHQEAFLPTLAKQHHMHITTYEKLYPFIRWRPCWEHSEINEIFLEHPLTLIHPVKGRHLRGAHECHAMVR